MCDFSTGPSRNRIAAMATIPLHLAHLGVHKRIDMNVILK